MADPTPLLALDRDDFRAFANRLDVMGGLLATFAPDDATTDPATLTFGYRGGRFIDDAGAAGFEPDGTIVIPNNVTRYVHFDPANGVTIAAALDRTKVVIAEVRTGSAVPVGSPAGTVLHIEDLRDINLVSPERTRWRGAWAAGTYFRNDIVTEGGALYIANTTTTAQPPDADWDLVLNGSSGLDVEDEGTLEESSVTRLNFIGTGVTPVGDGVGGVDVTIPGGIDVQDEGINVVTGATALDFIGDGVEVTNVAGVPTVEVLAVPGPGGGIASFPERPPASPSAYDEEGDQVALAGKWTEVVTPDASYVRDSDRDGTYLGMQGPGHTSNDWTIRQTLGADGDYPNAFTATFKLAMTAHTGTLFFDLGLSDNATHSAGNYILAGLTGVGTASSYYTNDNGTFASTALPLGEREIFLHLQRNTAATNNIKAYFSFNGRAWIRFAVYTKTSNFDYLWLRFFAGVGSEPSALWLDWMRINDARFLQPE